ncbi:MAG: hypothetical protein GTN80_05590 [Nitrososphaeria archaeon]|nr:hypothetical protein [Nitrososphaeria archaeon]NIQ33096.1 hypothetical protein [Nitrososphaeria archaeon]
MTVTAKEKSKVRVFRYNPDTDQDPKYVNYMIPYDPGQTKVLDGLIYIYEHIDGSLSFRSACKGYKRCGLCALNVNGKPGLACLTPLQKETTLEPLPSFPVIKDLVIDRSSMEKRIERLMPFLCRIHSPKEEPESIDPQMYSVYGSLSLCMECYICAAMCPVYLNEPREFVGPIAFVSLAQRLFDPRDELDRASLAVLEGIYDCSLCGKCEEACPFNNHFKITRDAIRPLFRAATERGIGPPPAVEELVSRAISTGRVIEPEGITLLEELPEIIKPAKLHTQRVAVFLGCMFNYPLNNVGKAAIRVVSNQGIEVILPKDQICCGMPMFWEGRKDIFERFVRRNVEVFERTGVKTVISLCSACSMAWKEDLMKMAEEIFGRKPRFNVLDIHEFLAKQIDENTLKSIREKPVKVTYSEPCHLHFINVTKEPRRLLEAIPDIQFIEMPNSDDCCGGFLRIRKRRRVADSIGKRKLEHAMQTDPDIIATACPMCLNQIKAMAEKAGQKNLEIKSIVELLDQALESPR